MNVYLTESAARKIASSLPDSLENPIAAILWSLPTYKETYIRDGETTSMKFEKFSDGQWNLCFYERSERQEQFIRSDRDVDFMFDAVTAQAPVSSARIDFVNGGFIVSYDDSNQ